MVRLAQLQRAASRRRAGDARGGRVRAFSESRRVSRGRSRFTMSHLLAWVDTSIIATYDTS
eukprot:3875914-Prymnesium_polylepis.1